MNMPCFHSNGYLLVNGDAMQVSDDNYCPCPCPVVCEPVVVANVFVQLCIHFTESVPKCESSIELAISSPRLGDKDTVCLVQVNMNLPECMLLIMSINKGV